MGWAAKDDVLKHYRMLTEGEASLRRFSLCIFLSLAATVLYFASERLSLLLGWASATYILYDISGVFFPSRKFSKATLDSLLEKNIPKSEEAKPASPGSPQVKEKEADAPVYAHKFKDDRPIIERLLTSQQGVSCIKFTASFLSGYVLTLFILSLPWMYACAALLLLYAETSSSLCSWALKRIVVKDIPAFPEAFWDKVMQAFQRRYSSAQGYYLIGEYAGRRIGLPPNERYKHTLVGGPTGTEKTMSVIIPPLLFDADSTGSAVIPDRKSPELFDGVSGRWVAKGKKAFLFDPWHEDTIAINLLHGADDETKLDMVEVIMHEKEEVLEKQDSFFQSRTRYLLYCAFKLVQGFKDEYNNLTTVFNAVQSVDTFEHFIKCSEPEIRTLFSDFFKMGDETRMNALTAIRERLEFLMDPAVRRAFSKAEFKLSMLFEKKEPCLLVIGAPMNKKNAGRAISSLVVNLIIALAFEERTLYRQALQRGEEGYQPNPLFLYADELRALKISGLPELVSIARDTRTQVIASTTDIGFLRYYRESFSSLMGNFRSRIFMSGLDTDSCKYLSDSLGKKIEMDYRYLRTVMPSPTRLNLMDPDDIQNLPEKKMIVFTAKTRPFKADKVSIHSTKWLKDMKVPRPNNMRALYEEWGLVSGPLKEPVLPKKGGFFDVAEMKSGMPVKIDPNISLESFHKEMGGGTYRKPRTYGGLHQMEGERFSDTDDGLAATADDDAMAGTL
jgi:type IV secretory pathway TraG/TraD family ATPase VirD4